MLYAVSYSWSKKEILTDFGRLQLVLKHDLERLTFTNSEALHREDDGHNLRRLVQRYVHLILKLGRESANKVNKAIIDDRPSLDMTYLWRHYAFILATHF